MIVRLAPRAGPRYDKPVAAGLDGVAVATVGRDARRDVVGVAVELATAGDICHEFSLTRFAEREAAAKNQSVDFRSGCTLEQKLRVELAGDGPNHLGNPPRDLAVGVAALAQLGLHRTFQQRDHVLDHAV